MKAPPFRYCRPQTLHEALELLARFGDDARVIAGGQSLLPAMALRLSEPAVLVDVARIEALRGIREVPGGLRVGAMSRHQEVEHSPLVTSYAPLLAQAMPYVAHAPIRARGTFGGSLALADPSAEAPAATLAHDAALVVQTLKGERRIRAEEFFRGLYTTALEPGSLLVAAEFPRPVAGERFVFRELARRSGDFATAGVAVRVAMSGVGGADAAARVVSARIVAFGVADRPVLATLTAQALLGRPIDQASIGAAREALAADVTPMPDLYHNEATKMRLLQVLLGRALGACEEGAGDGRAA